jgi:hypothetical protein
LFTDRRREETRALRLNAIEVDTTTNIENLSRRVAAELDLRNDAHSVAR